MRYYQRLIRKLNPEDAEDLLQRVVAEARLECVSLMPEEISKLRDYFRGHITEKEYKAWVEENIETEYDAHPDGNNQCFEISLREYASFGAGKIMWDGIAGDFDVEHILSIHKQMFSRSMMYLDGFREADFTNSALKGKFTKEREIEKEIEGLCSYIKDMNYLQGLCREEFVMELTVITSRLDMIHPFWKSTKLTIRLFVAQLALKNGYDLDFRNVSAEEFLDAIKTARTGSIEKLRCLIDENMRYVEK